MGLSTQMQMEEGKKRNVDVAFMTPEDADAKLQEARQKDGSRE